MKIVILGAGNTGSYVASVLSQEQHDITLIDCNAKALDQINRESDVATVLATMPNLQALSNVIERKPDLFFAATNNDETNLVSCSLAKNLGIPKTVARINSSSLLQSGLLDIGRLFYVDHFIGAEILSAQDLFKLLIHSSDLAFESFAHGAVLMRTIVIPSIWKKGGVPIKDLQLPLGLIVGVIRRDKEIFFPHGDDCILPGDEATLIGEAKIMDALHEYFHTQERRVKSVILVGGTDVALHLARLLLQQRVSVRIIEKDAARCKELSDLLPAATILNRNQEESSFLRDEGVESVNALVCCAKNDGANLLISSMAVHLGCPKVISLIGDPSYIPLFEKARVTPALSVRINVANRLLSILHEKTILSVGSISNDAVKIVELKVSPASELIGIPLQALSLPEDLLIAVIENKGKVVIGRGDSILCPDDTAIVICSSHCLEQNYHLFQ